MPRASNANSSLLPFFARAGFSIPFFSRAGWLWAFAAVALICQSAMAAPPKVEKGVNKDHAQRVKQGLELFRSQVRPSLIKHCVACHGGKQTKADFDLANRTALMESGMVEEDAESSHLFAVISHKAEPHMPHKAAKLPEAVIASIGRWIDLGAPYDKPLVKKAAGDDAKEAAISDADRRWWSFLPLARPKPPVVKQTTWRRTPIDAFILAKLEAKGLTPNDAVGRRQLIRRVYFDLLGLPPTPQQITAFVNDPSSKAYENLLDELLASRHYGERWARYWLDVARFAESHGFEHDYDRNYAYHFRDFVIKALNQDMPYNQFVRWQLAGDEIAPENPLALMATGFLGAGVFPTQITANEVERTRYDALDDMETTMGVAMLGLSLGCARCHDHKYDPISMGDYYRLLSTFTTTVRSEVELDLDPQTDRKEKAVFDIAHKPLAAALATYERDSLNAKFEAWLNDGPAAASSMREWTSLDLKTPTSKGKAKFQPLDDGSLLVSGPNINQDRYSFAAVTRVRGIRAVRLETLSHRSLPHGGPGRAPNGNFSLTSFTLKVQPLLDRKSPATVVKLVNARATHQQNTTTLSVQSAIDGQYGSGWAVDLGGIGKDQAAVFQLEKPVDIEGGVKLTFEFAFTNNVQHSIGRPRLSISTSEQPPVVLGQDTPQRVIEALALACQKGAGALQASDREVLRRWHADNDPRWRELNAKVQAHLKQEPQPRRIMVQICSEGPHIKPMRHHTQGKDFFEQTYLLKRGDPNQKQNVVSQSFLRVLMRAPEGEKRWQVAPPKNAKTSYRRRSLANWITDVEYGAGHLLARVMVNRLWQHHFGRGIVSTPNDFGFQGQRATHPRLLEYLASELVAGGWRLKPIHKQIMLSAVYLQSTEYDADDVKIDLQNHLHWRRTPRRLEAEAIRDNMLAVTGSLDSRMYGPGSLDESSRRRSIYFKIKRSKLMPSMQLFDAPEALVSIGQRPSTTIAPQALMFLNNTHVRKYALNFADRLAPAAEDSLARAVRLGYEIALGRPPRTIEEAASVAFIKQNAASHEADGAGNPRRLALADFAQVLLSLNEFVYVQ